MTDYFQEALRQARARAAPERKPEVEALPVREPLPVPEGFFPVEPATFADAGLDPAYIEGLLLKHLFGNPGHTGWRIAKELALPPKPCAALLAQMKHRELVAHRNTTATGDFAYDLSEAGRTEARALLQIARHATEAPVSFEQYLESVRTQSVGDAPPNRAALTEALSDLEVDPATLSRLGRAMSSGKGLFLFGPPGNGKTSIAKRLIRACGRSVYLPRSVLVGGQVVRVFDPGVHELDPDPGDDRRKLDHRWVRCKRPCVTAGGELTLRALEVQLDPISGLCEAPLQLKANTGVLVIDDFGRQRIDPVDLLNRWIVPMELRVDYLHLPDGRTIEVPFDPFLVFSTNLDPADLVDEAFLRRIPYKVRVGDPDEAAFRRLLALWAKDLGLELAPGAVAHLLSVHYRQAGRSMRFCHPRDLLQQAADRRRFEEEEGPVDAAALDEAVDTYFSSLTA